MSKDYGWDCNDHDDFLSSLLNDFGPTRTTQGINELGTDDAMFEWENKDQYMDTDDLLQNLSSDENEVVDNITVDMGKKMVINRFTAILKFGTLSQIGNVVQLANTIDYCAEDGGKEYFTKMHCDL